MNVACPYIDISSYQANSIYSWDAYKQWSAQGDGKSRVAIRVNEGTGVRYIDSSYRSFRAHAESVGIDHIIFYHYAYPQYNAPGPSASFFASLVGEIRPGDMIMLDYEETVSQATTEWAVEWLGVLQQTYPHNAVLFYSYLSFVQERMQDNRLANYGLILSDFTFNPANRPACPLPWKSYHYWQWTDRLSGIPGVSTPVDSNFFFAEVEQVNPFQEQQAVNTWNMFSVGNGKTPPPMGTGIFKAWYGQYLTHGFGSPLGPEAKSIDWNGNEIVVQLFSGGFWCEWSGGGPAHFYDGNRSLVYQGY